ncbi:hypothetical protein RIF23_07440 [Lipingzhangella sp. LS1_29]|uniref:Uncharacterized protein n=1 Tax=Lipingzhangella rawalii TaxID=2055835 RepID=A0ABU2H5M9_9ACTN|nr:hypothetical protein [Lipingzhangella rawalii]MDS1270125.1 hypothetical protein [Lipingzhangella rawalii]
MRSWQEQPARDDRGTGEEPVAASDPESRARDIEELYDPEDPEETRRRVRAELDRIYAGVTEGARPHT